MKTMKYPETAKRLTQAMNAIGISAQELSRRSGVGKSSISHYVNGTNKPHSINAGALAKVLNVDPMWLMGFDVEQKESPISALIGDKLEGVDVSNRDFIISMDMLSRKMTLTQMDNILTFAQFIKNSDDKKKGGDDNGMD